MNKNSKFWCAWWHDFEKGFTLLESLVAIAVFTVGVSSAVFVITTSINVGARVKHRIIAANLAQEGLEVVRNIRDRNWYEGDLWYQGINGGQTDPDWTGCLEWDDAQMTQAASCNPLSFSGTPPRYFIAGSSPYTRTMITQWQAGPPERVWVRSSVTCGTNCTVALEEYLYNWK